MTLSLADFECLKPNGRRFDSRAQQASLYCSAVLDAYTTHSYVYKGHFLKSSQISVENKGHTIHL